MALCGFREWLQQGYAGEMTYLHTQGEARRHPASILESVRSVLMVGMEYFWARGRSPLMKSSAEGITNHQGAYAPARLKRVAKYAQDQITTASSGIS